ncbi:MAG: hypothetical protein GQ582_09090 [Methyloprofundus sp.]|nr:hypothetical protein [Methyloprofundus sp.]
MPTIKWEYSVAAIFLIISILLGLLIAAQVDYAQDYKQQLLLEVKNVESASFSLQDIPESSLNDNVLDDYAELVDRPLFFNERRPVIPPEEEAAITPEERRLAEKVELKELALNLVGIINTPDIVYALFHDPRAKAGEEKFLRFKQGDDVRGRALKEIKLDRVILGSDTNTEDILLRKPRKHKASSKRRPARKKPSRKKTNKNPFNRKTKK